MLKTEQTFNVVFVFPFLSPLAYTCSCFNHKSLFFSVILVIERYSITSIGSCIFNLWSVANANTTHRVLSRHLYLENILKYCVSLSLCITFSLLGLKMHEIAVWKNIISYQFMCKESYFVIMYCWTVFLSITMYKLQAKIFFWNGCLCAKPNLWLVTK